MGVLNNAIVDIYSGMRMRHVWTALAAEDIGDQHRRTTLGPVWLLFNYLAFAGVFIFVFRRGAGIENYEAYVATGLLVWFYIMEAINGAVSLFVREESFIKGTTLPLSVYILRMTMQSVIRSSYALVGCLAILFIFGGAFSIVWLWSVIGAALIVLVTPAAITVFAFLGAFFPDSQYIVSNIMRIGMFVTPVFWAPGTGDPLRQLLYSWNPFTYFLEIVRQPLTTGEAPLWALAICAIIGLGVWILALLLLGTLRRRVVFVL